MGSLGDWRRRLAVKLSREQEVMVWWGKSKGRVGEMTGDGSARRKWAEWRAG